MIGALKWVRQMIRPRLSDEEREFVELLKRSPNIKVVGRGTVVRTLTDEDRERLQKQSAELAKLCRGRPACELCDEAIEAAGVQCK